MGEDRDLDRETLLLLSAFIIKKPVICNLATHNLSRTWRVYKKWWRVSRKLVINQLMRLKDYNDVLLTAANDLVEDHFNWMLDSAADIHICRDWTSFETLQEEENFGNIHGKNNSKLKIESIGRVRKKLHNVIVKTFANMKYVPREEPK